ncbi:MAG: hypothetical protein AAF587_32105 [Bacteroidota bacterium]
MQSKHIAQLISFFYFISSLALTLQAQGKVDINQPIDFQHRDQTFIRGGSIEFSIASFEDSIYSINKGKRDLLSIPYSEAEEMNIPAEAKSTSHPITLKRDGICYTLSCEGKLYWLDKNGDGKVQPRKELRCYCSKGKQCAITVTKSRC